MRNVTLWATLLLCLAAGFFVALMSPTAPSQSTPTSTPGTDAKDTSVPGLMGARQARESHEAAATSDRGAALTIEIRALSGDHPVRGAHVVVRAGDQVVAEGPTDSDGMLGLDGVLPSDLQVAAEASGFTPVQVNVKHGGAGAPTRVTLHLAGAHALRGRVIDEEGEAIAGAVVEASTSARVGSELVPPQRTRTNAAGEFEFAALVAGDHVLSARWPNGWKEPGLAVRVPLRSPVDLVLRRGATIEGTITSATTGQGLGGATVSVSSINYGMSASVRTDDLGRYALGPIDPSAEPAYLRVTRPGYRPVTQDALADRGLAAPHPSIEGRSVLDLALGSGDRVRLDFALNMGAEVIGTVRGPGGPLPNVVVRAVPPDGASWTRTNEDGEYRLVGLAANPVLIAVQAPGFVQSGAVHPLPARDPEESDAFEHMGAWPTFDSVVVRDIRMERGRVLPIHVLNMSGQPLPEARLWVRNEAGTSQPLITPHGDKGFVLSGVAVGGQLVVGATLSGYEGVEPMGVRIREGNQAEPTIVRMRERKELTVRGTVSSRLEATLRGAYVQVAWVDRSGFALDPVGRLKLWAGAQRHPVGPDGSYTVRLTGAPGRFAVRASALGHVAAYSPDEAITADSLEAEVDLVLAAGHRLDGQVLDASTERPVPGALLRLTSADASQGTAAMWYVTPTATDALGSFAVSELSEAAYLLEVRARGYSAARQLVHVTGSTRMLTIRLAKADGEIEGTVEGDTGAPFPDARIHAVQGTDLSHPVRSRPDGSFLLRGLRHTPATVAAGAAGHIEARSEGVPVGTRSLKLVLEPGVVAAGVALDGQGRPLRQTWINFQSIGIGHAGMWVRTDSEGRFRRSGLARGTHRLSLRADGKQIALGEVLLPDEDLVIRR